MYKYSFEQFKRNCTNFDEVVKELGLTKDTWEKFLYSPTLDYVFPENNEKFKLVQLEESGPWIPIDDGIADIIVDLNKKGYKTRFCCEGHNRSQSCGGYIFFHELDEGQMNSLMNIVFGIAVSGKVYVTLETDDDRGPTIRWKPNSKYETTLKVLKLAFDVL